MRTSKRVAIALEVAGSRGTVALVDHLGKVHHRCYAKTLWGRPAAATLSPYLRAVEEMVGYARAEGLIVSGLGV